MSKEVPFDAMQLNCLYKHFSETKCFFLLLLLPFFCLFVGLVGWFFCFVLFVYHSQVLQRILRQEEELGSFLLVVFKVSKAESAFFDNSGAGVLDLFKSVYTHSSNHRVRQCVREGKGSLL